MIEAFLRTFREIFTPFFWVIIIFNLIITCTFFFALTMGVEELIAYLVSGSGWLKPFLEWLKSLAGIGAVFISYLLFPIIFPIFSYIFQDFITSHLNKKYNQGAKQIEIPISKIILFALKFALLSIFLNLIFLPFYLIPLVGMVVYFCLNSYLLGREYYLLAASTLIEWNDVNSFRKENSHSIFLSGLVLSFFFLTPLVNLIAPIIGVIFSWFYVWKILKKNGKK